MNAHIQSEGEDNVIYTVHYRYTGSEESNGKTYSSTNTGTQGYTYVAGTPFAPYENSEAFQNVVIGWLENSLNMEEIKATIAADIKSKITPVSENLYFTWEDEDLESISEEPSVEEEGE